MNKPNIESLKDIIPVCKNCKYYRFMGLCYFQNRLVPKEPYDKCDFQDFFGLHYHMLLDVRVKLEELKKTIKKHSELLWEWEGCSWYCELLDDLVPMVDELQEML